MTDSFFGMELATTFVVKLNIHIEMNTNEVYKLIKGLGMINTVCDHITQMRRLANQNPNMAPVARKTVYDAFDTEESERTELQNLIVEESRKLVQRITVQPQYA